MRDRTDSLRPIRQLPAIHCRSPRLLARRIIEYVYLTSDGIFGIMAEVLAEFIIPFVAFGAFLERAGVAKFFVDISLASLGRIAGGPAQASVVSSLLMGTISGSPIAETVTKGPITIPLMKRAGFPPHIAGAVEAAASTGAAIMPPVMGAGAFVMSEMTGIPYLEIIKVAAIPGILFFLSVGVMVYFESTKLGLRGLPAEELPSSREVWARGWYLLMPIAVLIGTLIIGYSPQLAALYGMLSTIVVSWIRKETRMGVPQIWQALVDAGKNSLFRRGSDRLRRHPDRRLIADRDRHPLSLHVGRPGRPKHPLDHRA